MYFVFCFIMCRFVLYQINFLNFDYNLDFHASVSNMSNMYICIYNLCEYFCMYVKCTMYICIIDDSTLGLHPQLKLSRRKSTAGYQSPPALYSTGVCIIIVWLETLLPPASSRDSWVLSPVEEWEESRTWLSAITTLRPELSLTSHHSNMPCILSLHFTPSFMCATGATKYISSSEEISF